LIPAAGYLYPNGNAVYTDPAGHLLPEHGKWGWSGLHSFLDVFPEAKVYFALEANHVHRIDAPKLLLPYLRYHAGKRGKARRGPVA